MDNSRMEANFHGHSNQGSQIGQQINYYHDGLDWETQLIHSLSGEYRSQKDINPKRAEGTCEWFLNNSRFHRWRDSSDSCALHILTGPGYRKSVLARYLVDKNRVLNSRTQTVIYFFFKDRQGDQKRSATAIRSLLHQLFTSRHTSSLVSHAAEKYRAHRTKFSVIFDKLWDVLLDCAAAATSNIVYVLDTLDECRRTDRYTLIEAISNFYSRQRVESQPVEGSFKLLVTSRPYPEVEIDPQPQVSRTSLVKFDGDEKSDEIAEEINHMIEVIVPRVLRKASPSVQQDIIGHLQSRRNKTYLWLHLILAFVNERLAGRGTASEIKRLTRQLPPSIDDLYDTMLNSSPAKDLTKIILSIVCAALRPLTLRQAKIAFEIARGSYKEGDPIEAETDAQFTDTVRELCGLLITIYDGRLHFLHETAREFVHTHGSSRQDPTSWKRVITAQESNYILASACVIFMNRSVMAKDFPPWVMGSFLPLENQGPTWTGQVAFFAYASGCWPVHYKFCGGQARKILDRDILELCVKFTGLLSTMGQIPFVRRFPYAASNIAVAAFRLLPTELAKRTIECGMDKDCVDACGSTPLAAAVSAGNELSTKFLLDNAADQHHFDVLEEHALSSAAAMNHGKIVQALLDSGARIDQRGRYGETALVAAIYENLESMVLKLLEDGAGVNVPGRYGIMPLEAAATIGSDMLVRILVRRGAVINRGHTSDDDHRVKLTALHQAAAGGHKHILLFLLDQGANVSLEGGRYSYALHAAAARGHESIVRVLLDHGADAYRISRRYGTAVQLAAAAGHDRIVQLLLDGG